VQIYKRGTRVQNLTGNIFYQINISMTSNQGLDTAILQPSSVNKTINFSKFRVKLKLIKADANFERIGKPQSFRVLLISLNVYPKNLTFKDSNQLERCFCD